MWAIWELALKVEATAVQGDSRRTGFLWFGDPYVLHQAKYLIFASDANMSLAIRIVGVRISGSTHCFNIPLEAEVQKLRPPHTTLRNSENDS